MSKKIFNLKNDYRIAIWYCYKDVNEAVFLNRKDQVIKRFDNYNEAVEFAEKNIHLIDN